MLIQHCHLSYTDPLPQKTGPYFGPGICNYGLTTYHISVEPAFYHLGPGLPHWALAPQTAPITITFPQLVYNVGVGVGADFGQDLVNCEDMGSVSFSGVHNGTVNLRPIWEEYCDFPPGSITASTPVGAIGLVGGVSQLTITPMSPIVWEYVDPAAPPWDNIRTAVGRAFYSVVWDESSPALWGPLTNDCATGDSILDLQATRDLLKALWDSSRADLPPIQRREFKGGVFQDWGTGEFIHQVFPPTDHGPCHVRAAPQGPLPGKFILGAHVHPAAPGDLLPCDPSRPSRLIEYDALKYGGPSKQDFAAAAEEVANGGLAHIIMDAAFLYHLRPGADTTNFTSTVTPHPRDVPGQCVRP